MSLFKNKIIILSFFCILIGAIFTISNFFIDDNENIENNKKVTQKNIEKSPVNYNIKVDLDLKENTKIKQLDELLETTEKELLVLEDSNKKDSFNKQQNSQYLIKLKNEIQKIKSNIAKLNINKN